VSFGRTMMQVVSDHFFFFDDRTGKFPSDHQRKKSGLVTRDYDASIGAAAVGEKARLLTKRH